MNHKIELTILIMFLMVPIALAFYDPSADSILHQQDFEVDGVPGAGFNGSKGLVNNSSYGVYQVWIDFSEKNSPIHISYKAMSSDGAQTGIVVLFFDGAIDTQSTITPIFHVPLDGNFKDIGASILTPEVDFTRVLVIFYRSNRIGTIHIDDIKIEKMFPRPPEIISWERDFRTGRIELVWEKDEAWGGNIKVEGVRYNIYRSKTSGITKQLELYDIVHVEEGKSQYLWSGYNNSEGEGFEEKQNTYYYAISSVDKDGRESILSTEIMVPAVTINSIEGTVNNSVTGDLLKGALVLLKYIDEEDKSFQTKSDINGKFVLARSAPAGRYLLSVWLEGYERWEKIIDLYPDTLLEQTIALVPFAGQPREPLNLEGFTPCPSLISLSWQVPEHGSGNSAAYEYRIYRSTEPFGDEEKDGLFYKTYKPADDENIPGQVVVWYDNALKAGESYYYRVTSVDAAYNESSASNLVGPINPEMLQSPQLITLSQGEIANNSNLELSWSTVEGATGYIIELSQDSRFSPTARVYKRTIISEEKFQLERTMLFYEGRWYWRVRAFSSFQENICFSDFSEVGNFVLVPENANSLLPPFVDIVPKYIAPRRVKEDRAVIRFFLNKPSSVSVKVFDLRGFIVKSVLNDVFLGVGEHEFTWNGTNIKGEYVKNGLYKVLILISNESTSKVIKDIVVFN